MSEKPDLDHVAPQNGVGSEQGRLTALEERVEQVRVMTLVRAGRFDQLEAVVDSLRAAAAAKWGIEPSSREYPLFRDTEGDSCGSEMISSAGMELRDVLQIMAGIAGAVLGSDLGTLSLLLVRKLLRRRPMVIRPFLAHAERGHLRSAAQRAFTNLARDFADIDLRLVRCAALEKTLGEFERALQGASGKYQRRCVALLRDVLSYNYAEDLTPEGLAVMESGMDLIAHRQSSVTRDDCRVLRNRFIGLGLCVLPVSEKAIAEEEAGALHQNEQQ